MQLSSRLRCFIAVVLLGCVACLSTWAQLKSPKIEEWGFEVVAKYPHDVQAFTQGLQFHRGKLYEGTGSYGASTLRRVNWQTGEVEQQVPLQPQLFGEGITILEDKLYQLTWQNRVGLVYAVDTLAPLKTFEYSGEGWGLTHDGQYLIMSDGTSLIRFLDPKTFKVEKKISAHMGKQKINSLNELEYIEGEIWANIWHEDRIVRLSPQDGQVLGWINLAGLYPRPPQDNERVLNGIAFDPETKKLVVTGKYWPELFEIKLVKNRVSK